MTKNIKWYQTLRMNLKTIRKLEERIKELEQHIIRHNEHVRFIGSEFEAQKEYIKTMEQKVLKKAIVEDRI